MNYNKILLGILFGVIGQVGTFLQLQGSYKYGWYEKYQWLVILASVPLGWYTFYQLITLLQDLEVKFGRVDWLVSELVLSYSH